MKTRYEKWLDRFGLETLRRLAEEGLPDGELAARLELTPAVFTRWRKLYPEFDEAIKLGRAEADYTVVKSLYKKATGYNVAVNKTYKLKRVDYDPDTGKKLREYEELATGVEESHVPADLRAEAFWLKNRQPDRWSDKPERESADGEDESGVIEIPAADRIDGEES